jgi:hypothetical protein
MFVSDERALAVSYSVAAERLARVPASGWPGTLSQAVYAGGVEYLMRVGPSGAVPAASRLVRVRFTQPNYHDGMTTLGLRWEATGVAGLLFPALDADIRLDADGDTARVTLTASYRPPLGVLGAELDRVLMRTVAMATIRTLLNRVAEALEGGPAESAAPAATWSPDVR